jgi:molybdopterin biosynthesis enzyme
MARKDALIVIPEGWEEWIAGEIIDVQLLNPDLNYRLIQLRKDS